MENANSYFEDSSSAFDEDDDVFLDDNSSTSTAGPPPDSPPTTGRFGRPSWNLASLQHRGSGVGSPPDPNGGDRYNATGAFQPLRTSLDNTGTFPVPGEHHTRTVSTSSTSVSPMNSSMPQQEWGRSFRLFSTTRYLPNLSRRQDSVGNYSSGRSPHMRNVLARGSFASESMDRITAGAQGHRQSTLFASFHGPSGGNPYMQKSPELRSTAPPMAAGGSGPPLHLLSSPLVPLVHSPFAAGSFLSLPYNANGYGLGNATHLAAFALGGGQDEYRLMSPAQKNLDMVLNSLRAYIAITGDTITVDDLMRSLEIKRGAMIGLGGFAKVYVGLNTVNSELVAVKEINVANVDDVEALNAVEEEFALLRSIRHPNIIRYSFFEHSKSQQVCRIVMEFLAGDSTAHLLKRFGPLTETVLRKLARDLLHAMACIHKEGIFHRDIKPANILVSHKGEVKLCDFGCSKRVNELNKASSCIIGTPAYMAPELIKGEADHKADIWAMACTLFELATGMQPWYHSGVRDHLPLMFYITTTSETPLVLPAQDGISDFSPELLHFMELCFIRDPVRRPEAHELLRHPWVNGLPLVNPLGSRKPSNISIPSSWTDAHDWRGAVSSSLGASRQSDLTVSPHDAPTDDDTRSLSGSVVPATPAAEAESMCQRELEEVAADIATDLCSALMNCPETILRSCERRLQASTTSPISSQVTPIASPFASQNFGRTSSFHGPWPVQATPPGSAPAATPELQSRTSSPDQSLVHENFSYSQAFLSGTSAGGFVFPAESVESTPQQQFLRINEDGNLDFATVQEEDTDLLGESGLPKSNGGDSDGLHFSSSTSRALSPGRSGSFSRRSLSPSLALDVHGSPHRARGGVSHPRTGSPSRFRTVKPPSPLPGPQPWTPPLPPSSASSSVRAPRQSSHNSSCRGTSPHSPCSARSTSTHHSASSRPLPSILKPDEDGLLHMSFSVSTAPGREVSIPLDVDISDVHCTNIDNQPSYVVAMSANVRRQITSRIKEVADQEEMAASISSRSAVPSSPLTDARRSPAGSLAGGGSGGHFYNAPGFNSAGRSPGGRSVSRTTFGYGSNNPSVAGSSVPGSVTGSALAADLPSFGSSRPSAPSSPLGTRVQKPENGKKSPPLPPSAFN